MPELDQLRRLGDEIVPPSFEELRKTAGRRTRRTAMAVTVAVAAAATAVLGAVQAAVDDQHSAPPIVHQPHRRHHVQQDEQPASRPLTYAEGPTVHYGDQSVTLPDRVVELDLSDDGVTVRTADDRIWFTDGSAFEQVGAVGEAA